jgi:hypothetical protein
MVALYRQLKKGILCKRILIFKRKILTLSYVTNEAYGATPS